MSAGVPDERGAPSQHVVILLGDGFDPLDLGALLRILGAPAIETQVVLSVASVRGGMIRSKRNVQIDTIAFASAALPELHWLILICGDQGLSEWDGLLDCIGDEEPSIAACLVGSTLAASVQSVVRRDRPLWRCPGGATAIDLGLLLVEQLVDRPAALALAEELMVPVVRHPDDPVVGTTLSLQVRAGAPFAPLLRRVMADLTADLRVETLAEWCNMTPRTFARRFARQMGMTPAYAIAQLRFERARQLIGQGDLSLKEIAARSGFRSELGLRRATARFRAPAMEPRLTLAGQD